MFYFWYLIDAKGFLKNKSNVAELIFVAVITAVGASLIASYLTELITPIDKNAPLYLGGCLVVIGATYLFIKWKPVKPVKEHIEGFFYYNPEHNNTIHIPRYRFSYNLSSYLQCAFTENEELLNLWAIEPLSRVEELYEPESKISTLKSISIIRELIEYSVLDTLSNQFLDYIHSEKSNHFREYKHNDPEILALNNRFLNLFSKPMSERACFINSEYEESDDKENWVMAESSGALFQRFDFALPKKSTIKRIDEESILIDTPRAKIKISCIFDGGNSFVAESFCEVYLGIEDYLSVSEDGFAIRIEVEFKPLSIVSILDWDKYSWIDSFIARVKEEFCEDLFLQKIGWESSLTLIQCLSNVQKTSRSVSQRRTKKEEPQSH